MKNAYLEVNTIKFILNRTYVLEYYNSSTASDCSVADVTILYQKGNTMEENGEISMNNLRDVILAVQSNLLGEIQGVKNDIKQYNSNLSVVKKDIEKLKQENEELKERLGIVERQMKRKNLIFQGIDEKFAPPERAVLDIVNKNLGISLILADISNCFRLGKPTENPRPILLELLSGFKRRDILVAKPKLKNTKIYINEDLTKEELYQRKALLEVLKDEKLNNCNKRLKNHNRIEVEGTIYTFEEITERKKLPIQLLSESSPIVSGSASAPSTPSPKEVLFEYEEPPVQDIIQRNETEEKKEENNKERKVLRRNKENRAKEKPQINLQETSKKTKSNSISSPATPNSANGISGQKFKYSTRQGQKSEQ
ncbi:unnamed protein product [Ceutorhynchus assimilis]|uniref:Endonuclease-reverse transcriptase n=1 Tax=Ceutorhynchus assimilis TaxID=467358 RepID=A0A9N9QK05_9CUCU|nr:unnamed protein product [Ceutorhynchus assimilis]